MQAGKTLTKAIVVLLLSTVMLAGFYFRMDNLSSWLNNKDRFFFAEQQIPLMLTVDSYYYLEMARQLQQGSYSSFDKRRHVPIGYKQPATPPLLAVILARISTLSGANLEWVALLLPAFLGILLAIPVYLLTTALTRKARGKLFVNAPCHDAARIAGLVAALAALMSPMFAGRSAVGWCDTDALNVVFPVLLAWLAIRFTDGEELRQRMVSLTGFAVTALLFLWWWDQSHIPVFGFVALPLLMAAVFTGIRSPRRLLPLLGLVAVLLFAIGCWKGFSLLNPMSYLDNLQGMTKYISSETGNSPFRAAGEAVSEQARTPLIMLMRQSSGGRLGFWLACTGLAALVWLARGYFLFLLPLVVVAALSLTGQRFLIFTAPLFGIGIGTLVFLLFCLLKKPVWRIPAIVLLVIISCWGAVQLEGRYDKRVPRRLPGLFDAMQIINTTTDKDAVIWASWGHGHPLLFYGQRSIIGDGIFHNAELQYVLNFPFSVKSFQLAANWISFYVEHGSPGLLKANQLFGNSYAAWPEGMDALQELLANGIARSRQLLKEKYQLSDNEIEKKLHWLFPGNPRPVYLFLDYLLPNQAWFILGQWNLESRLPPTVNFLLPLQQVALTQDNTIRGRSRMGSLTINPKNGQVRFARGATALSVLDIYYKGEKSVLRFANKTSLPLHAQIFLSRQVGVLSSQQEADRVLVKLYFQQRADQRFFRLVKDGHPYYVIWQVFGEQY
jgi:dolichyl-diphosphooligosaccharide--protein glycosyltransferase